MEKTIDMGHLSRRYEELLRSMKYYDITFHVDGDVIKCHKLILAAASPVFEAMFFGSMREMAQEIEILDISSDSFKAMINYIYKGCFDFEELPLESIMEIYYGAEKYLLNDLINDCLLAVTRKLRFSNILSTLELSVSHNLIGLMERCMSFFTHCCLSEPQYMTYLKNHYLHVSKDCVKAIIASNKDLKMQLLWYVDEWCRQECNALGLQPSDYRSLIMDQLQLKEYGVDPKDFQLYKRPQLKKQIGCALERSYYKACQPFTVSNEMNEWKFTIKCDRFLSIVGLIMHSRLAPKTQHARFQADEYYEYLDVVISTLMPLNDFDAGEIGSDGEDGDHEYENDNGIPQQNSRSTNIFQHSINKQMTKYNCTLNIHWPDKVVLSPDFTYEVQIIWHPSSIPSYGAEYPCSLQSNKVNGIEFRDSQSHPGSLIKGVFVILD